MPYRHNKLEEDLGTLHTNTNLDTLLPNTALTLDDTLIIGGVQKSRWFL